MDTGGDIVLEAFVQAVGLALREMAGLEPAPRSVATAVVGRPRAICACLHLKNGGEGDFALDFPSPVADALVLRVCADSGAAASEALTADCVGEVANVVAGQAKTLLFGLPQHFQFSTPSLQPETLPHPGEARAVVTFASEIGEFFLYYRRPSG